MTQPGDMIERLREAVQTALASDAMARLREAAAAALDAAEAAIGDFVAAMTRLVENIIYAMTGAPADPDLVRAILSGGSALVAIAIMVMLILFPFGRHDDMRGSSNAERKRAPTLPATSRSKKAGTKAKPKKAKPRKVKRKAAKRKAAKSKTATRKKSAAKKTRARSPGASLAEIERAMIALKVRFEAGEISRDDYVADTKKLYDRARKLA